MTKNPWKRINDAIGANGILLIGVAAVLLMVIYLVIYQYTSREINEDLKLRAQSELRAKSLTIQNIMNEVETAVRNHVDDVSRFLHHPDSMYSVAKNLVELNPIMTGSSISFVENFYPEKGKWFEAYAVKDSLGNIQTMQLGSEMHDYFQSEFFINPLKTGKAGWTNPYLDSDGAKMMLTTYSVPVFDKDGKIVGVLDADISLDWLEDVLTVEYAYPSSYHVLLSKAGQLMSVADKEFRLKTIPEMSTAYGNDTFLPLNEGMMSGKTGETVIIDKKGNRYRSFYMPVDEDTGWSIAIINSEKEIFSDAHNMRVALLWLSIAGFLILLLIIVRAILNIKKLEKISSERERIKSELQIASSIQMGMLPKGNTLETTEEKIEIEAFLEPAKEVGGDLYDYFVKDDHLFFCIGDVSGKGVPASLFMAVARSLFRALASNSKDSSQIISGMNDTLAEFNERDLFVTLFLGVLDLKTGRLEYCNAGHDSPIILDSNGISRIKVSPNLPLGIFEGYEFINEMVQLRKDSILFLYTDGITEAMNISHEEFGEDRLNKSLEEIYSDSACVRPKHLIEGILKDVKSFVGKAEQSDDLTMLALKFNKTDSNVERSISLKNDIAEINILNKFVEEVCHEQELSLEITMDLKLAIEEIVVNSMNYGFDNSTEGNISVNIKFQSGEVLVEIKDNGKEFDPTQSYEIDLNSSLEEREIGGLGLFLLKQLTDTQCHRRVGNVNILTFSKTLK